MRIFTLSKCFSFVLKASRTDLSTFLRHTTCGIPHNTNTNFNYNETSDQVDDLSDLNETHFTRGVPLSLQEYKQRKKLKPIQPENPYLLRVAFLGEPNVGKSTLTNSLVKWKVCAVSKKVHTTRHKSAIVFVEDSKQVVFLDTPGFVTPEHSKKHHLEVSLVVDPEKSVREADLVAVIVDVSNKWTSKRINPDILKVLNNFIEKKSILILNKVDAIKRKQDLLGITRILTKGVIGGIPMKKEEENSEQKKNPSKTLGSEELDENDKSIVILPQTDKDKGWAYFSDVFMVSALKDDGVDKLRNYLLNSAKPRNWLYHSSIVIDENPFEIACSIVREKLLDDLPEEVPYNLTLKIRNWDVDISGCLRIEISIICSKFRYKRLIIGSSGRRIAKCVEESRQALQDTFRSEIYLKLAIVVAQ